MVALLQPGSTSDINLYVYTRSNPVIFVDPKGKDARLVIDQQQHTITIQSTVHLYARTQAERQGLQSVAQQAQAFYANPTVATEQDVQTRTQGKPVPNRGLTYTDPSNQTWTIRFDIQYRVHQQATAPIRIPNQTLQSSSGTTAYEVETQRVRSEGIQVGDNVMTFMPGGSTGGRVRSLSIGDSASNVVGELRGKTSTTSDRAALSRRLIHETGHFIGFDERYDPQTAGLMQGGYPGFEHDIMAQDTGSPNDPLVIDPTHIQALGNFSTQLLTQAGSGSGTQQRTFLLSGFIDDTQGGRLHPQQPQRYTQAQTTQIQRRSRAVLTNTSAWQQAQQAQSGQGGTSSSIILPHVLKSFIKFIP